SFRICMDSISFMKIILKIRRLPDELIFGFEFYFAFQIDKTRSTFRNGLWFGRGGFSRASAPQEPVQSEEAKSGEGKNENLDAANGNGLPFNLKVLVVLFCHTYLWFNIAEVFSFLIFSSASAFGIS